MATRQKLFLSIAFTILLTAGATWAFAHGGDTALIHSCVNNSSGTIKIVSPNTNCANNEIPLDWSPGGAVNVSSGGGVFSFKAVVYGSDSFCISVLGQQDSCDPEIGITGSFQVPVPSDGKLVKLAVYVEGNGMNVDTTVTAFVNGSPSDLQVTIPAGATSVFFGSGDVDVQAGDVLVLIGRAPGGLGDVNFTGTLEYQPD